MSFAAVAETRVQNTQLMALLVQANERLKQLSHANAALREDVALLSAQNGFWQRRAAELEASDSTNQRLAWAAIHRAEQQVLRSFEVLDQRARAGRGNAANTQTNRTRQSARHNLAAQANRAAREFRESIPALRRAVRQRHQADNKRTASAEFPFFLKRVVACLAFASHGSHEPVPDCTFHEMDEDTRILAAKTAVGAAGQANSQQLTRMTDFVYRETLCLDFTDEKVTSVSARKDRVFRELDQSDNKNWLFAHARGMNEFSFMRHVTLPLTAHCKNHNLFRPFLGAIFRSLVHGTGEYPVPLPGELAKQIREAKEAAIHYAGNHSSIPSTRGQLNDLFGTTCEVALLCAAHELSGAETLLANAYRRSGSTLCQPTPANKVDADMLSFQGPLSLFSLCSPL